MLPICATLALASVMSMVYDQIDSIMLRYMRGEAELGFYAANYKIMTVCLAFMPILGRVFFPLLSQAAVEDSDEEVKYLRWMATGIVGLAIPITVGGLLLAGPVSLFLLGRQYAGSEQLLRWLMPNVIAAALASYYCGRLVPRNREGKYLTAVLGGAVVNVTLNLAFIPRFGAVAAAASTVVSQLAVAVLGRYFERDLPRPMLRAPVGASLLASAVMVAGVLALRKFQLHVLILVFAGAILYAAAYWAIWVAALSRAVKRA
jgi:O-antigen/teichoic acid export membrane protein